MAGHQRLGRLQPPSRPPEHAPTAVARGQATSGVDLQHNHKSSHRKCDPKVSDLQGKKARTRHLSKSDSEDQAAGEVVSIAVRGSSQDEDRKIVRFGPEALDRRVITVLSGALCRTPGAALFLVHAVPSLAHPTLTTG